MVAFTWILGFGSLLPTWHEKWGKFGLDINIHSCSILPDSQSKAPFSCASELPALQSFPFSPFTDNSPKQFLFFIAFALPCLAIIVCYARIFYIVRSTALRTKDLPGDNLDENSVEDVSSAVSNQQQQQQPAPHPGQYAGSSATITPEKDLPAPPPLSYINFSQHDADWHYIDSSTENEIFCSTTSSTEDVSHRAVDVKPTHNHHTVVDRCDCSGNRVIID